MLKATIKGASNPFNDIQKNPAPQAGFFCENKNHKLYFCKKNNDEFY